MSLLKIEPHFLEDFLCLGLQWDTKFSLLRHSDKTEILFEAIKAHSINIDDEMKREFYSDHYGVALSLEEGKPILELTKLNSKTQAQPHKPSYEESGKNESSSSSSAAFFPADESRDKRSWNRVTL